MGTLQKQKRFVHGKTRFLIGVDQYDQRVWLESASFDCGWYWGFGYMETKDSHTHFNGMIWNKENDSKEYTHHINQVLKQSVLTDSESWKLSDLMKSFYTLKAAAELFHMGGSHLTTVENTDYLKDSNFEQYINEILLPELFLSIYKILTQE